MQTFAEQDAAQGVVIARKTMGAAALSTATAAAVAASLVCMHLGRRAIRAKARRRHARLMLSAFALQIAFAVLFAIRLATYGLYPQLTTGAPQIVYLVGLTAHEAVAVSVVPLVIATLLLGLTRRRPEHRTIAPPTLTLWMFVSYTGLGIYALNQMVG